MCTAVTVSNATPGKVEAALRMLSDLIATSRHRFGDFRDGNRT